jgi:hypothetical protein
LSPAIALPALKVLIFWSNMAGWTKIFNVLFAGGIDLFRSDNGGSTWGPVSHWAESPPSAHANQHVMVFHPGYDGVTNQTMYLATDLGVFTTRQGGNVWSVKNSGFANAVTESLSLQQRAGEAPVLWAFTHGPFHPLPTESFLECATISRGPTPDETRRDPP